MKGPLTRPPSLLKIAMIQTSLFYLLFASAAFADIRIDKVQLGNKTNKIYGQQIRIDYPVMNIMNENVYETWSFAGKTRNAAVEACRMMKMDYVSHQTGAAFAEKRVDFEINGTLKFVENNSPSTIVELVCDQRVNEAADLNASTPSAILKSPISATAIAIPEQDSLQIFDPRLNEKAFYGMTLNAPIAACHMLNMTYIADQLGELVGQSQNRVNMNGRVRKYQKSDSMSDVRVLSCEKRTLAPR